MIPRHSWAMVSIRPPVSRALALAGLFVAVCLSTWISEHYLLDEAGLTSFWPVNALILVFVLRASAAPAQAGTALAVGLAAMATINLIIGRPLALALIFPVANTIEILIAAWFMRRTAVPLNSPRDLGQFLLGAVVAGPLACALIAAAVLGLAFNLSGPELVRQGATWLTADMMGMAIVAPFALSLGSVKRGGWLRALLVPGGIGLICFALCWQTKLPVIITAFPLTVFAVLHDRDRGGALSIGAVAVAVIGAGLLDQGPMARLPGIGVDPVMAVPIYFGALVLTVHPVAALMRRLDALAAELDRRRVVAEDDSAAKSELIGRVGEELRSPLTGVVTVAEMLRSGRLGDLNIRQRDLLARIAESGAEIEQLSREMVALGDGAGELTTRTAAVAEVIDDAAQAIRFRARRAGVALEVLPGDPLWRASIDPERLKRLVVDALACALDASTTGGAVRVIAGLDGEGRLRLVIEDAGAFELAERQTRFSQAIRVGPTEDGVAFDRSELRRIGGDLRFGAGALGGGQVALLLPRAPNAEVAAAA